MSGAVEAGEDYTALSAAYDEEIRLYYEWMKIAPEQPGAINKKKAARKAWMEALAVEHEIAGPMTRDAVGKMLQLRAPKIKEKRRKA